MRNEEILKLYCEELFIAEIFVGILPSVSEGYLIVVILPLSSTGDLDILESRQIEIRRLPDTSKTSPVRLQIQ